MKFFIVGINRSQSEPVLTISVSSPDEIFDDF